MWTSYYCLLRLFTTLWLLILISCPSVMAYCLINCHRLQLTCCCLVCPLWLVITLWRITKFGVVCLPVMLPVWSLVVSINYSDMSFVSSCLPIVLKLIIDFDAYLQHCCCGFVTCCRFSGLILLMLLLHIVVCYLQILMVVYSSYCLHLCPVAYLYDVNLQVGCLHCFTTSNLRGDVRSIKLILAVI